MRKNPNDQMAAAVAIAFFVIILAVFAALAIRLIRWILGF